MDVWDRVLGIAGRSRLGHRVTLADPCATPDEELAGVRQRDLVAVGRLDRDRQAVGRNLPGERDLPGGGSTDRGGVAERDVDAAVLPTCVLVVSDRELPEHWTVHGPRPGERSGCEDERDEQGQDPHEESPCCL
jgi:hypothetical protein